MATYKVIQDIEAEDKFLGPLTLKQFIFGAAGLVFGYLSFFALTQGATFLLVIFLPPMLLGIFLAIPWSSEQPTEVWVLAKLRFRLKPKIRIWNQSGLEELVTITVPKTIERHLTNGLDQTEVESRLKALAETIDSRGWATKNATLLEGYNGNDTVVSERLLSPAALPQDVPEVDINSYTDVLDENNSVSENFDQMIKTSSAARRQQSLEKMERIRHGESLESIQQAPIQFTPPVANTTQQPDEQLLSQQLHNKRAAGDIANGNMRTVAAHPPATQPTQSVPANDYLTPVPQAKAEMTRPVNADIIDLAQNNDLNISTIARQSHKSDPGEEEVVISLR